MAVPFVLPPLLVVGLHKRMRKRGLPKEDQLKGLYYSDLTLIEGTLYGGRQRYSEAYLKGPLMHHSWRTNWFTRPEVGE